MSVDFLFTFGEAARAAKIGFFWSARNLAFIRISEVTLASVPLANSRFKIEVAPAGLVPTTRVSSGFVSWQDNQSLLDSIDQLKTINAPTVYQQFVVDAIGMTVI